MPQNDETNASGQAGGCDKPDCLACTIRNWIEANHPNGLSQAAKLEILTTLAYAASGLAALHGGFEAALTLQMALNDGAEAACPQPRGTKH